MASERHDDTPIMEHIRTRMMSLGLAEPIAIPVGKSLADTITRNAEKLPGLLVVKYRWISSGIVNADHYLVGPVYPYSRSPDSIDAWVSDEELISWVTACGPMMDHDGLCRWLSIVPHLTTSPVKP